MAEPSVDVVFVGETGIGKSSLINMVMGVPDNAKDAAKVSRDAPPCTIETTYYRASLDGELRCLLWDTRGLNEAVDAHDRGLITKLVDLIRRKASEQARKLRKALRDRTRLADPILVWCIEATKIDFPAHWQHFRRVYVDYCERKAIPMIVITRMSPNVETDWEERCRRRLQELELGEGFNPLDVRLLRTRKYKDPLSSCTERSEDSEALKHLISELAKRLSTTFESKLHV